MADKPNRDNLSSTSPTRGRGRYTSHACSNCHQRKRKCEVVIDPQNGRRSDCERCLASKTKCVWTSEQSGPQRKGLVKALRSRIKCLEEKLANCTCQKGKGKAVDDHMPSDASGVFWSEEVAAHSDVASDDEVNIAEFLIPTTRLVLDREADYLQHFGPSSIFRLAPSLPGSTSRLPEIFENHCQRYVLQVDGANHTHCNPNFDWSRHLPREVFMERREHDKLLDLLFKFFTSWCLRIVPPLFFRDMSRALLAPPTHIPLKTPHYSPMLHNALLALAMAFSDDPLIRDLNSRQFFVRKAKSYLEADCQRPNISVMHALSALASFHISQGDQTLGYIYFGMSTQISQALGLNIDCSSWVNAARISRDDMLDRNWAYWTIFSQDVCWSFYVGRRGSIPLLPSTSNLPVPFVDSEYDQIPWHYPPSGIAPQPNYLSRTLAETCELLKIASQVMDFLQGLNSRGSSRGVHEVLTSNIDDRLRTWKDCLSPEVDITPMSQGSALPHRLMLHLAYWWQFILLHRPFYRRTRTSTSPESVTNHIEICNEAASNIMELLNTWRSSYTLRYVPLTMAQVVFSAGSIFLLASVQTESGSIAVSLAHLRSQAGLCIQYLSEIGQSWNCANDIRAILDNLLQVVERLVQQRAEQDERLFADVLSSEMPASYESDPHWPSPPQQVDHPLSLQANLSHGPDVRNQQFNLELARVFGGGSNQGPTAAGAIEEGFWCGNSRDTMLDGSLDFHHVDRATQQTNLNRGNFAQDPSVPQWLVQQLMSTSNYNGHPTMYQQSWHGQRSD